MSQIEDAEALLATYDAHPELIAGYEKNVPGFAEACAQQDPAAALAAIERQLVVLRRVQPGIAEAVDRRLARVRAALAEQG